MFYASWGFVKSCLDWNLERDPTAVKMLRRVPPYVQSIPEVSSWSLLFGNYSASMPTSMLCSESKRMSLIFRVEQSLRCKSCYLQTWCTDEYVLWRLFLCLARWSGPTLAYPKKAHQFSFFFLKKWNESWQHHKVGLFFRHWQKSLQNKAWWGWRKLPPEQQFLFCPPLHHLLAPTIMRSQWEPGGPIYLFLIVACSFICLFEGICFLLFPCFWLRILYLRLDSVQPFT